MLAQDLSSDAKAQHVVVISRPSTSGPLRTPCPVDFPCRATAFRTGEGVRRGPESKVMTVSPAATALCSIYEGPLKGSRSNTLGCVPYEY